ncbi:Threonine/homoserine efflux transporter RhtA [Shimia gijangensis]|uniref:Threonine/homoserine efflux transporter RhtA n=1 Tax=Shimia gijangensis TaxID=1470563 RepID=A0A1M6GVY9_9RHOB|nr:DMT family transporter [Shimia gijangensis]SHJ14112.1 Threonine/homoserine efflux transporter RhtA [Shimia gijangensis]
MWQALFIMFIAMSMIPAGDTAGKLLMNAHDASPHYVAWSRFAIGALVALPLLRADTIRLLADWRIWLRAMLLTGGILSIQTALATIPLADTFAAFFIGPIFSYGLSVLLLGEKVTLLRSLLMLLGFAGVLLVVRPGFDMEPGLIFAVLAGLCYGAFLTSSRWLAPVSRPGSLLFTQLFLSFVMMTPICWNSAPPITAPILGLTTLSALFSMGGNFLLLFAYARASATSLAPYVYFQLIAAVALGWLVFEDLPDGFTIVGLTLIVGAGIASALAATRPRP